MQQDFSTMNRAGRIAYLQSKESQPQPQSQAFGIDTEVLRNDGESDFSFVKRLRGMHKEKTIGDAFDEVAANPSRLVPFVSGAKQAYDLHHIYTIVQAIQGGSASKDQQREVLTFLIDAARETSFGYKVGSIAGDSTAFIGEFIATGGLYNMAKRGTMKLLSKGLREAIEQKALKKAGVKVLDSTMRKAIESEAARVLARKAATRGLASKAAEVAAAKVPAMMVTGELGSMVASKFMDEGEGGRITASTWDRALPGMGVAQDPEHAGQIMLFIDDSMETFMEALPRGVMDQYIELTSEHAGGALTKLAGLDKLRVFQLGILEKLGGGSVSKGMQRLAKAGGWHGVMGEFLEERAGALGRALVPGMEDDFSDIWPGLEGGAAELLAFSMMGGAMTGAVAAHNKFQGDMSPEGRLVNAAAAAGAQPGKPSRPQADPGTADVHAQRGVETINEQSEDDPVALVDVPEEHQETAAKLEEAAASAGVTWRWYGTESGKPAAQAGLQVEGGVVLADASILADSERVEGLAREIQIHEFVHDMGSKDREVLDGLISSMAQLDPEGFAEHMRGIQEAQGGMIPMDLLLEEGAAARAQGLRTLVDFAETEEGEAWLEAYVEQSDRPTLTRLIDWVRSMLKKVGIGEGSHQDRQLAELQEKIGTATSVKDLRVGYAVAQALKEIRDAGFKAPGGAVRAVEPVQATESTRAARVRGEQRRGVAGRVGVRRRAAMERGAVTIEPSELPPQFSNEAPSNFEAPVADTVEAPTKPLTPKQAKRAKRKENRAKKAAVADVPTTMQQTKPDMFGQTEELETKRIESHDEPTATGQLFQEDTGVRGQASILDQPAREETPAPAKTPATKRAERRAQAKKTWSKHRQRLSEGGPDVPFRVYLRANGGVRNWQGEFTPFTVKEFPGIHRGAWGLPPLILREDSEKGMGWDDAMVLANEGHYFTRDYREADINDFIELLEQNPNSYEGGQVETGEPTEEEYQATADAQARAAGYEDAEDAEKQNAPPPIKDIPFIDPETGEPRFAPSAERTERYAPALPDQLGFFSQAQRAAGALPQKKKKYTRGQVLSQLKKAGVKDVELKWLGLEDRIKGGVTKEELNEIIRSNVVTVEETVLEGRSFEGDSTRMQVLIDLENNETITDDERLELDDLEQSVNRGYEPDDAPKHADAAYQLPGGSNYRELLLRLPERDGPKAGTSDIFEADGGWRIRLGGTVLPPTWPTYEESFEAATYEVDSVAGMWRFRGEPVTPFDEDLVNYTRGHYGEYPNVLAHIRFNERTDSDGNRVLFIEEIQSDWAATGAKIGYRDGTNALKDYSVSKTDTPGAAHIVDADGAFIGSVRYSDGQTNQGIIDNWAANQFLSDTRPPDHPFKDSWETLSFRRMVRWAAEHGFDKIGWTTGTQQVRRYATEMRRSVDQIAWGVQANGDKHIEVFPGDFWADLDSDGVVVDSKLSDAMGKSIYDVVGKSIAKQIMAEESGTVEGDDLTIGGKGMHAAYDVRLVNIAKKIGKPFGAVVGHAGIGAPSGVSEASGKFAVFSIWAQRNRALSGTEAVTAWNEHSAVVDEWLDKAYPGTTTIHTLPITPEMRESVMQVGFPRFAPAALPSGWLGSEKDAVRHFAFMGFRVSGSDGEFRLEKRDSRNPLADSDGWLRLPGSFSTKRAAYDRASYDITGSTQRVDQQDSRFAPAVAHHGGPHETSDTAADVEITDRFAPRTGKRLKDLLESRRKGRLEKPEKPQVQPATVGGAAAPSSEPVPAAAPAETVPPAFAQFMPDVDALVHRLHALLASHTEIIGRPDLAKTAATPEGQEIQDAVDELRNFDGLPENVEMSEEQRIGEARVVADPETMHKILLHKVATGQVLNAQETFALGKLTNMFSELALQTNDPEAWREAARLNQAYRQSGSEASRAFRARQSQYSRTVRAEELVTLILARPTLRADKKLRKLMKQRQAAIARGDTATASQAERHAPPVKKKRQRGKMTELDKINRAIEDLLNEESERSKRVTKALERNGYDPTNITEEMWGNPYEATKLIRIIGPARADALDKMREYLYSSMLSHPMTQVRNAVGNTLNIGISKYVQDIVESAINIVARDPNAPSMGEVKLLFTEFTNAIRAGGQRFTRAYKVEPMAEGFGAQQANKLAEGIHIPAISSDTVVGKIYNALLKKFSLDTLRAADEGARGFVEHLTVRQLAHRQAARTGDNAADLIDDPRLVQRARDTALEMAFMEELEDGTFYSWLESSAFSLRKMMDGVIPFSGTMTIPFIGVSVRLLKETIRRSPAQPGIFFAKFIRSMATGKHVPKSEWIHDTADSVISMMLLFSALSLLGMTDDDGLPIIGGTPADWKDKTATGLQRSTAPAYTLRIGKHLLNFKGRDPIAGAMALAVDAANGLRDGGITGGAVGLGKGLARNIVEQPYMQGLSDLEQLMGGNKGIGEWLFGQAIVPWVPNILRGGARDMDSQIRERAAWKREEGKAAVIRRGAYSMTNAKAFAPPPKFDVYGRPVKRTQVGIMNGIILERNISSGTAMKADILLYHWSQKIKQGGEGKMWYPQLPKPYYTEKGKKAEWAPAQYSELTRLTGEDFAKRIERHHWRDLQNPTQKDIDWIKGAHTKAKRHAKRQVRYFK